MGMVVDIIAGKNNRVYKSNNEKMLDFTKVADDVVEKLDNADYKNIKKNDCYDEKRNRTKK